VSGRSCCGPVRRQPPCCVPCGGCGATWRSWDPRWLANHRRRRWRRARHWVGPVLATLDGVIGTVSPESMLGFPLVTLRRDLADLGERLAHGDSRRRKASSPAGVTVPLRQQLIIRFSAWISPAARFMIGLRACATFCLLRSYGVPRLSPKGHNPWCDRHHDHQSRRSENIGHDRLAVDDRWHSRDRGGSAQLLAR
jgi:hypothetical protein